MGYANPLNKIKCRITLSKSGNSHFLNEMIVCKNLTDVAREYFDKYGLDYEIAPYGHGGLGGGALTLQEILNDALAHLNWILLITTLAKALIGIIKNVTMRKFIKTYPRVLIDLNIYSKDKLLGKFPDIEVRERLLNLKNISDGLRAVMIERYPLFKYDQTYSINIAHYPYNANFLITSEQNTPFNSYRLQNLFLNLKIRKDLMSNYGFNKVSLVVRNDRSYIQLAEKKNFKKRYFLFLSVNVLRDYFNKL